MRKDLLNARELADRVDWTECLTEADALQKIRRRLVHVLVDRINREDITEENEQALTDVLAKLRGYYNPSGFTGAYRYNRNTGERFGAYVSMNFAAGKESSADKDIKAILQVLSEATGLQLSSIADIA